MLNARVYEMLYHIFEKFEINIMKKGYFTHFMLQLRHVIYIEKTFCLNTLLKLLVVTETFLDRLKLIKFS